MIRVSQKRHGLEPAATGPDTLERMWCAHSSTSHDCQKALLTPDVSHIFVSVCNKSHRTSENRALEDARLESSAICSSVLKHV